MSSKSQDVLAAWGAFFVAHAFAIQRVQDALSGKAPLTLFEYDTLLTISRAEGGRIRYSELASASVFTKSGITRLARRLEERGFLERSRCESDKRGAFIAITKQGHQALAGSWKLYSKAILDIFDPALTQSEAMELQRLMTKIIDRLDPAPLVKIGAREPVRQKSKG